MSPHDPTLLQQCAANGQLDSRQLAANAAAGELACQKVVCDDRCDYPACQGPVPQPAFRVTVNPLRASNGITYVVCLDRGDRALDAMPWDNGRITPINRNSLEEANYAGQEWAEFLGVAFTPCGPAADTAATNTVPEYGDPPVNASAPPVRVACITLDGVTLTCRADELTGMFSSDDDNAYALTFKTMTAPEYEALGEFDGF